MAMDTGAQRDPHLTNRYGKRGALRAEATSPSRSVGIVQVVCPHSIPEVP